MSAFSLLISLKRLTPFLLWFTERFATRNSFSRDCVPLISFRSNIFRSFNGKMRSQLSFRLISWAPLHFRAIDARPVSYYAFFKGWLLPSLPAGCLCINLLFPTKKSIGDLNEQLGLFPFWLSTLAPKVCLQLFNSFWLFFKKSFSRINGIRSFHEIGTILCRPQPRSALPPFYNKSCALPT